MYCTKYASKMEWNIHCSVVTIWDIVLRQTCKFCTKYYIYAMLNDHSSLLCSFWKVDNGSSEEKLVPLLKSETKEI